VLLPWTAEARGKKTQKRHRTNATNGPKKLRNARVFLAFHTLRKTPKKSFAKGLTLGEVSV
jgi:hypothetical protein